MNTVKETDKATGQVKGVLQSRLKNKPVKYQFRILSNIISMKPRNSFGIAILISILISTSCKKAVEVDSPDTGLVRSEVFKTNATAIAAMTSIYSQMTNKGLSGGNTSISVRMGLAADELQNYSVNNAMLAGIYKNALSSVNKYFWTELYQLIYYTNTIIEGVKSSNSLSPSAQQQLIGEAKFMRAFLHFYAVNIYGNVPLVTSTDYRINNVISRSDNQKVYDQIVADLLDAQASLSDDFLDPKGNPTTERVRPNKAAATAMLARVYLYLGRWKDAESQATLVISNSKFNLETDLSRVFLRTSSEAIWQLQAPNIAGTNTADAPVFVLTAVPSSTYPVALNEEFVNSFDSNDNRASSWIGKFTTTSKTYYYPYKYKVAPFKATNPTTEYTMVIRLAEMFLIRAEARAQSNELPDAISDLNVIRLRSGLSETVATTQDEVINAIGAERKKELFTEWGHRWFDLKRTGKIDQVMGIETPKKGGSWSADWSLFPIPQAEILINPNLSQNEGYQ